MCVCVCERERESGVHCDHFINRLGGMCRTILMNYCGATAGAGEVQYPHQED